MLNTLTTAVCSLFSYDALSYSVPQLPQASIDAPASLFSALLVFIILISGCGLIALQMRRVATSVTSKAISTTATANAAVEDVHMSPIDGHNLNQKGKQPEGSKIYTSARAIQVKCKAHGLLGVPFAKLSDHQKVRRRVYDHLEADDPTCFSLKDVAIEHNFNQLLRRQSNGSIKELPAVQPRSPLAVEQCSKIDLIKKAAVIKAEKSGKLNFSLLKSFIKA